ncbi:MAG: tyrosine protein phosphatase yvh1 [Bathelium mastoideum]|nr:MAG: tyrosine protein phosphatase yvh1 [Bathelium mastoideum]
MNSPRDLEAHSAYQRWLYRREVELSRECGQAPDADKIRFEDEHVQQRQYADGFSLKCRKCRRPLATSQFVIEHEQNIGGGAKEANPPNAFTPEQSCAHYFLDPLSWMRTELEQGKLDGRLECPKCKTNVGKYAWQANFLSLISIHRSSYCLMPAPTLEALALKMLFEVHSVEEYRRQRCDSFIAADSDSREISMDRSHPTSENAISKKPPTVTHRECGPDVAILNGAPSTKGSASSSDNVKEVEPRSSISETSSEFPTAALSPRNCHMITRSLPRMNVMTPPPNYGAVIPGCIFRSGFPREENFTFLQSLKLKTVLTLVTEAPLPAHSKWMQDNNIKHLQIPILPNKEGKPATPVLDFNSALAIVFQRVSHPILIHCNQGRHRTGCIVACFRRITGVCLAAAIDEYQTYADPKARPLDKEFIQNYDTEALAWVAAHEHWIASPEQPRVDSVSPVVQSMLAPKVQV